MAGKPLDERVEAFLADVLALEGEEANAMREGVRGALADYEFRAQEVNKRMKEKAAHACHALCRARVVEEIRLRKGTPTEQHLKLVLSGYRWAAFSRKGRIARATPWLSFPNLTRWSCASHSIMR